MALNKTQKSIIKSLYTTNYLSKADNPQGKSNRAIAKDAKCSESAVRTEIKKLIEQGVEKNALNSLAKKEAHTTIIQDEIKTHTNALNAIEKTHYNEVLIDEIKAHKVANGYQALLMQKIESDQLTIDALMMLKKKELKTAKTIDEITKIELKYNQYLDAIVDTESIKRGVEANDKAMITKGEAQRHASSQVTVNTQNNMNQNTEITKELVIETLEEFDREY